MTAPPTLSKFSTAADELRLQEIARLAGGIMLVRSVHIAMPGDAGSERRASHAVDRRALGTAKGDELNRLHPARTRHHGSHFKSCVS
jgi:hypothetical protein